MTGEAILVVEVTAPTDAHVSALERLVPQLSSTASPPDIDGLCRILGSGNGVRLFAAHLHRDDTPTGIVGFAVLAVFRTLTGVRGWLEDVVVDADARNRGIGGRLVAAVVDAARAEGCRTLDLTSRPSRETANRLYERSGFSRRETNVWRLDLAPTTAGAPSRPGGPGAGEAGSRPSGSG